MAPGGRRRRQKFWRPAAKVAETAAVTAARPVAVAAIPPAAIAAKRPAAIAAKPARARPAAVAARTHVAVAAKKPAAIAVPPSVALAAPHIAAELTAQPSANHPLLAYTPGEAYTPVVDCAGPEPTPSPTPVHRISEAERRRQRRKRKRHDEQEFDMAVQALSKSWKPETATSATNRHRLLKVVASVNCRATRVMFDSGATHDVVSRSFCKALGLDVKSEGETISVTLADGTTNETPLAEVDITLFFGASSVIRTCTVFDSTNYDVICGKPFFTDMRPVVDWRANTLHWTANDGTRVEVTAVDDFSQDIPYGLQTCSWSSVQSVGDESSSAPQLIRVSVNTADAAVDIADDSASSATTYIAEFADVITDKPKDGLPPHREGLDHDINLEPGSRPPAPYYIRLSVVAQQEMRQQITRLLELGYLRPSSSPFGAAVFFVKKHDGSLRLVCDWRGLNNITVKDHTLLPNPEDVLDQLQGASIFSCLDLNKAYHQLRMREEDIPKTAIRTAMGSFEWTVMAFGMSNAPATFQRFMNTILAKQIGKSVVVYLDDILVYSKDATAHDAHVREVLEILRKHQLTANPAKCQFFKESVKFLGHIIGHNEIGVDKAKIAAVERMAAPTNIHEIRRFMGLCNYFRKFVPDFSHVAEPIHRLTHKAAPFIWGPDQQQAFATLRGLLVQAPVLRMPDFARRFIIATDASDVAIGAVLLQEDDKGDRHPIAYFSKALQPAERNWPVHEREMFAILRALQHWSHYCNEFPILVETDHRPLEHLPTQRELSKRQHRWVEKLADFNHTITYVAGKVNTVADALSRPPDATPTVSVHSIAVDKKAYETDSFFGRLLKHVSEPFKWIGNELYLDDGSPRPRMCVPTAALQRKVISEYHDVPFAAHRGRDQTAAAISADYFWPRMRQCIAKYVSSCPACQRAKARNTAKPGLLQPLPIPTGRWESVSVDFMTDLPMTQRGCDALMVVVDRLTKRAHFIPTKMSATAQDTARLFRREIFRLHGLPREIVSDRDPKFTATWWAELWKQLGTTLAMSTPAHPETDGQTERVNRIINEMMRTVLATQVDWQGALDIVEFAYNNAVSSATGKTPFEADIGLSPRIPANMAAPPGTPQWDLLGDLDNIMQQVRDNLRAAQSRMQHYANQHREDIKYNVGDMVLVSRDRIAGTGIEQSAKAKWQPRFYGPYRVLSSHGSNAYTLDMPTEYSGHKTFNTTHLRRWTNRGDESTAEIPPAPTPAPTRPDSAPEQTRTRPQRVRIRNPRYSDA